MGNVFALISAKAPTGLLPKGPNFTWTDLPDLDAHFPNNCADTDQFKFVKLPTIFPLTYSTTTIKGSIRDDSIGNATHSISDAMGPFWIKLIAEWTKPFADAIWASPATSDLLPALKNDQQWADHTLIQSQGLTDDEEEAWDAIKVISEVWKHFHTINIATPAASSVMVSSMPNNRSVLILNSNPKVTTPTKMTPTCPTATSQADVHSPPCMSFNPETVNQALVMATFSKEEPRDKYIINKR